MTIRARMHDGVVLTFPDGTADDIVDRVAQEYVRSNPAPTVGATGRVRDDAPDTAAQPAAPERSFGERMLRQAGLGARALAHGVTQLPALAGDVVNAGVNFGVRGVNAATGAQIPELGRMSDVVNRGIDAVTPAPENATERVVQRVGSDLVSLATGGAAARAIGATGPLARRVADVVTARPVAQTVATAAMSGGGAVGRELLQDADPPYPPGAPRPTLSMGDVGDAAGTVAGAAAGAAIPALANVTGRVLAPLTQTGRERMVTQTMLNNATDPQTLAPRLMAGQREIVPGSQRTTAEVAGDPGLIGVERGARNMAPRDSGDFALRDAARTAARRTAVEAEGPPMPPAVAGREARGGLQQERTQAAAEVRRLYQLVPDNAGSYPAADLHQAVTPHIDGLYANSTPGFGPPASLQRIINRIDNTANPPAVPGQPPPPPGRFSFGELRAIERELSDVAGRADVQGNRTAALAARRLRAEVRDMMDLPPDGLTPQQMADHRAAVAARRAMGAAYDEGAVGGVLARNQYGRTPGATPGGRVTAVDENVPGNLTAGPTAVQQTMTAANGNPRVRDALRGALIDDLMRTMETTTVGATRDFTDSAARFHQFMRRNQDALQAVLGPQGVANLQAVQRDFVSRQMVDTVGRAVGSNTAQNLSVANVLAEAFGGLIDPRRAQSHPLMRAISAPYRWANVESALRETLTRAMLDPDFATVLVSRATPQMMRRAVSMLNQNPSGWATAGRLAGMAGRAVRGTVGPLVPGALNAAANRSPEDLPPER